MIGKKNVLFGLFYLVLTASLGPYMILKYYDDVASSDGAKQQKIGALQQARDSGYEGDLEKMNAEQIAKADADAEVSPMATYEISVVPRPAPDGALADAYKVTRSP